MLLPGSNPSSTGTIASSDAGDPIRIRRSATVPASGATPALLPVRDCARRSPRRGADGLRRYLPFRPGALRGAGFVADASLPDGFACVIVACACAASEASVGADAARAGVACDGLAGGVLAAAVAGVSMPGAAATGVVVAGVLAGGVLPGVPGTGCGDEVPAERSCGIEPSVRAVNAAGEFDLLAVDNSGEIHNATRVFLDEN
jgi:hypothetical protein